MGKTWVVFIENSEYETFPRLEGPTQDVILMKAALMDYKIDRIIHKQNMTKKDMEDFFSRELPELIINNRVNSILVWYAGHGKFIYDTGYWIPVDAKRDKEATYFNTTYLKESLQKYENHMTHILVITDACESGPSFYQAMRNSGREVSCSDLQASQSKSSQVFSSSGYDLAIDESKFTRSFAEALKSNATSCIPIEKIVSQVTSAVMGNNQQKPKFGKIDGLIDDDGTFFFISK
ncbi:MAG: caspase family protein [Bacteroidales bacterium]|nr:caspase family protein [Bacteroidales bacterium]